MQDGTVLERQLHRINIVGGLSVRIGVIVESADTEIGTVRLRRAIRIAVIDVVIFCCNGREIRNAVLLYQQAAVGG